ncbi:hypothetical protein DY052_05890 [Apilactobacillus timberlakei]|uniref:hypothetical protein n=1 Tax=Apilactobacillus timberlakei TaxID=2008380 RepID=UPI00112CCC3B|nr:hypothetical protein [Apilactobacillus timberlakei]TPR14954.1 hypothetical protein DY052_05890 [Apilactobacillus timberlakei]
MKNILIGIQDYRKEQIQIAAIKNSIYRNKAIKQKCSYDEVKKTRKRVFKNVIITLSAFVIVFNLGIFITASSHNITYAEQVHNIKSRLFSHKPVYHIDMHNHGSSNGENMKKLQQGK